MASNLDVVNNNTQGLIGRARSGPFGSAFISNQSVDQPVEEEPGRFGASADQMQYLLGASLEFLSEGAGFDNLSAYWGAVRAKNKAQLEQYDRLTFEKAREEANDLSKYFLDLLVIDGATLITSALAAAGATALTGGGTLAALSGAGIASFALNAGDTFAESVDAVGKENVDKGLVLGASLLMAGLDAAVPGKIGGAFVNRSIREKVKASAAKNLAKNKWWSRAVKVGLQSSFTEAGTEGMQEVLQAATINAQEGKDPFDFSEEQIAQFQEAAWAGGFLGFGAGASTSGFGRSSARKIIGRKEEAVAQVDSELELKIAELEAERTSLAEQPRDFKVRKRSNDIRKEISELRVEANKKKAKIWGADSEAAINKIVPIKEQEAEAEAEAVPEEEKTLAQIMAEDPRTAEAERQQQPDEVLPVGTQRGPSATQEQIEARLAQEPSGPTQADVMPDTPVAPIGTQGRVEPTLPTTVDPNVQRGGGPVLNPREEPGFPGSGTQSGSLPIIKDRADRGTQSGEGQRDSAGRVITPVTGGPADIDVPIFGSPSQDPSVIQDTIKPEVFADPSVVLDSAPDQTGAGPQGRPRRSFAALREEIKARDKGPQVMNRPVINTVIGDGENVLVDGDVLITAADIEEAKFAKASRELEDEASTAYNEAYNEVVLETGGDHGQASIAGEEARTRVLREGGATRRRVYSSRAARLQSQREAAKQRQDREARLNFEAQRRIDERKKLEKEQAAELKEQAIEMAGETYDAFFYGQISAQEFASRRQSEIARIKNSRIGGTAAANAYRKAVPLEKANAILKERGLPTLKPEGDQTTQKDAAPDKAATTPDAPPEAAPDPNQADATPPAPEEAPTTQAKVPDISNVVIKDPDPIILEENKRIKELEKKREAIDDALETDSPELSELIEGKNLEHEKLLLEEMELRINQMERGLRERGIDLESRRIYDDSNPRNPLPGWIRKRDQAKKNIEALEAGVDPVTVPGTTMNPYGNKTPTQADATPPVPDTPTETAPDATETGKIPGTLDLTIYPDFDAYMEDMGELGFSPVELQEQGLPYDEESFAAAQETVVPDAAKGAEAAPATTPQAEVVFTRDVEKNKEEPAGLVPNQRDSTDRNYPVYEESKGIVVTMTLDEFISLNPSRDAKPEGSDSLDFLRNLAEEGGTFAPPFIDVEITDNGLKVVGHEGRGRALVAKELGTTGEIEVDVFFKKGDRVKDFDKSKGKDSIISDARTGSEEVIIPLRRVNYNKDQSGSANKPRDKATTPPDIAVTDVDEDQTQDQQIADMIAREQATVARETADQEADAEFQAGTDDTGPTVEDVDQGVDTPVVDTTTVTPDMTQAELVDDAVVSDEDTFETVIPKATTTRIELDKYESSVPNPQGVEAIVYEDPENPDSFIVESEGTVIRREPNKQDAVLYADKMSEFVANREKKKARNAFVPRPEGKTYTGPFLKGLGRGTRALLAGTGKKGDSFRLSLDKNKQKIAENNDIPYDENTTEEDLYDALYAKYIAPKEEAAPTELVEPVDVAGEVQEEAERIVASDYGIFGNKINRAYPEPIDEYSSDEEADAIIAASEAKQEFAETDDPSALIELTWDDGDAEIRAEAAAEAEETARRTAENRAVKLTPEYWTEMLDTNTALKDISKTKSQGGFEISELRTIADNILKADPSFVYNKKGTRKEIEAAIKSYIIKDVEPVEDNSPYIDTVDDDTGIISTEYKESRIDSDSVEQEPFLSGEVLFSKDEVASSIRQELKKIFGVRATNEMFSTGFVKILSRKQAAAEHNKSKREFKDTAAFVHNASVTFIPENIVKDNVTPDMIRGLIWHEIGAHVGRSMLSSNEFSAIIKEVRRLHKQGDMYVLSAFDAVASNYKDIYKDFAKPVSADLMGYGKIIYGFRTKDGKNPIEVIGEDNIFWEEVLAHMLEYKGQELDLQRASLMKRVKDAFKKFFIRIFKAYDVDSIPDVTVDDIFNTMAGVVIERMPTLIQRAKMFDASREKAIDDVVEKYIEPKQYLSAADGYLADAQTKARNEFIEDSLVKGTVYHGSEKNWSAPILEFTEMGLHVGTMKAALKIVDGKSEKLTEGYIKVTNPFTGVDDIGHWAGPKAWRNELNKMMRDGNISDKDYKVLFSVANEWTQKLEPFTGSREIYDGFVKFSSEYRDALKSLGYDSIQYVNKSEDPGNLSYILLSEDQFKASSSFTFTSGVNAIKDARIASESPSKNLPIMKKINDASKEQGFNTRKAQGKITQAIKTLQRAVEPLMTLEGYDELETQRMLTKGEIGKWHNQGRVIFDVIFQATPQEKKEIIKYFETRDASPDKLPNRKVNVAKLPTVLSGTKGTGRLSEEKSIRDSVVEAKKQIEKLGSDLVAAGLITQDQYSQWRGKYLPRVYFEYLEKGDRIPMGIGTSQMNYTKVRSAHENFLKDVVDGRIEDPAFLAGRYVSMAGADLATINYLSFLAADTGNNGWVLPNQIVKYDNIEGTVGFWNEKVSAIMRNAAKERGLNNNEKAISYEKIANEIQKEIDKVTANKIVADSKKYKQVPNNPRYGAMRGLYVRKEIINDVIGSEQLYTNNEFLNGALAYSAKAQKVFKYTKVPMNIPTQARNIISNIVLMDVSGTNFLKIPGLISRAIADIASDGKYAQLARKYGIESTTFTSEELVNIDAQFNKIKAKEDSWSGMWARSKVFFNDYVDVFGRTYQKTEVMFKVAKMIDFMENHGKSESEAARLANEALLDYSNVSQAVRVIRTMPLGSPFITFNLKAASQMVRNMKNHPIAVAKYAAIPYVVAQMLLENNSELEEDDIPEMKKLVADYMEKNATSLILPWKDQDGRIRVFDMGYFLPWGAHINMMKNLYQGEFGEAAAAPGFFGGWMGAPIGMLTNVDPFTKQEITNDADPPMQQYQDMTAFLLSYMMPPMFMPRNKSGDVIGNGGQLIKTMMAVDFMDGNVDADGLPKYSVPESLISWAGFNFSKLSDETAQRKIYFKSLEVNKTFSRLKKLLKDPNISEEQRQRLISEYTANALRIQTELQEMQNAYAKVKDVL